MSSKILLISTIILLLGLPVSARVWTNHADKEINADFVRVDGDKVVLLIKGREIPVVISTLCEEDQRYIEEKSFLAEEEEAKATKKKKPQKSSKKGSLPLDRWISGDKLEAADLEGKVVVFHQWQEHCGACPPKLEAYEKMARRKKTTGAIFLIWHSHDKPEEAAKAAERLRLKMPIYHGKMRKWDKEKFGKFVWPHVVIMNPTGEIIYMGEANRSFDKALKEATTTPAS